MNKDASPTGTHPVRRMKSTAAQGNSAGQRFEMPAHDPPGHRLVGFVEEAVERRAVLQFADQTLELHDRPDLAGGQDLRRNDDRFRGEMDLDQHGINLPIPAE